METNDCTHTCRIIERDDERFNDVVAKLLHISDNQLSYITNVGFGKGLLKCGNSIVPFVDNFPKNTRLYQLMSTKPNEKFL